LQPGNLAVLEHIMSFKMRQGLDVDIYLAVCRVDIYISSRYRHFLQSKGGNVENVSRLRDDRLRDLYSYKCEAAKSCQRHKRFYQGVDVFNMNWLELYIGTRRNSSYSQ
jgi:hypothetical protein